MVKKNLFIAMLLVAGFLASSAQAAEYYVDQKSPAAGDKNPGTEDKPFATIQAACDVTKPGDTIWVKAGGYEEPVRIKSCGAENAPITLSAWRDDRVRIGYAPRPLPMAGKWAPAPNSKSWQVELSQDVPEDFLVLLNGKHIVTFMQDGPVKDEQVNRAAYRKSDRTLMFNANGKDPASLGKMEYGRRPGMAAGLSFFHIDSPAAWWVIRKIEFSWSGVGIYFCGDNCTVEDCYFHHCYRGAIGVHGRTDTIRRCNIYRCGGGIGASGAGPGHLIEDNLIVECGQQAEDDILIVDIPTAAVEGSGPTVFKGTNLGMQFTYNIVSDNPCGSGWYADCSDSQSSGVVGNAFWDNPGGGIYNEASVDDTLAQGNLFYRNGASSSVCGRWNVIDNLFFQGGVTWHNMDLNPARDTYNLLRGNAFINPGYGYLSTYAAGWAQTAFPEVFRGSMVDHNRIWADKDAVLINNGGEGKKYKSIEDIRKEFGWEIHGRVTPYDKDKDTVETVAKEMGGSVVTFRIPWGKHSAEARPMLANSQIMCRWPGSPVSADPIMPNFFWRIADGAYNAAPLWGGYGSFAYHQYWLPHLAREEQRAGCRWFVDGEARYPANLEEKTPCRKGLLDTFGMRSGYGNGNFWLAVEGVDPAKMLPQGVGYWSPLLGAAPGAKVTISLKMRGKDLLSSDKGSPAVWLQFTNETGQHRQRFFLVGKDDAGKMHNADLAGGSYEWKDLKETITAPADAVRMALFMGLTPCKGEVNFDDIDINTASEEEKAGAEILPPRLPLQRIKKTYVIDISKLANRGLADEINNDGKGGWSDQGASADMRELKTGQRLFGGVPFDIRPGPKSVIVLRSDSRAKGDLPDEVTIPVGNKLDTLFFLHSAAWCPGGGVEAFRYVIHYADGKDVTLKVTGNNLADWIADPIARFPLEEGTFTTVAETVKTPQFRQGSIYRMEWSAPLDRRGVEIKSIDFAAGEKQQAVPILLGITGVTEW